MQGYSPPRCSSAAHKEQGARCPALLWGPAVLSAPPAAAGAAPPLPGAGPQQLAGGKCLGHGDGSAAGCFGVITGLSLSRFIRQPSVLVHATAPNYSSVFFTPD